MDFKRTSLLTFTCLHNLEFNLYRLYCGFRNHGYIIYPVKLTVANRFRIGCIGRLCKEHMKGAISAIKSMIKAFSINQISYD